MHLSYIAINRMVEEKAAADKAYRKILERNGQVLLSHGRGMPDDTLLAKLRALGLRAERQRLLELFPRFISAQKMANELIDRAPSPIPDAEADWVWIAVTCLWERRHPLDAGGEVAPADRVRFRLRFLEVTTVAR